MFSSVHTRLFMLSFIIIKRRYEKNNNRIRIVYDIEWVHFNFLNPIIYFFITRQNIFKTLKFYLLFLYFLYLYRGIIVCTHLKWITYMIDRISSYERFKQRDAIVK